MGIQVTGFIPCKILWYFRKVEEDTGGRTLRRWRKRLALALYLSSLSCPAEAGSMYRTGQEMPLSGACLTSAEMHTDANILGREVFPTVTFVGDLT